ncbi:unnamed protein product [Diamesa serratosioi]
MMVKKLSEKQLGEYREAFVMFDTDNDEFINTKELLPAMRAVGYNPNSVILDLIKEKDVDSEDGIAKLNFDEFVHIVCQQIRYTYTSDDIIEDFKLIDTDGDGNISKSELQTYLSNLNMSYSDEEIEEMVNEADLDNDGTINYQEFILMMCPNK